MPDDFASFAKQYGGQVATQQPQDDFASFAVQFGGKAQAIDYNKPAEPSNLEKLGTGVRDFTAGIGSQVIKRGTQAYDLARRGLNSLEPASPSGGEPGMQPGGARGPGLPPVSPAIRSATQPPPTPAGRVGAMAENIGEFVIPGSAITKGVNAVRRATTGMRGARATNALARPALEGVSAASVTGVQTGGDTDQMKTAGMTAGVASMAIPAVVGAVGKLGRAALGKTTGAGEESIRMAATNPTSAFKKAMRSGTSETEIVNDFKGAVNNAQASRSADYTQKLAQISQQQIPPIDISPVRQQLMQRLQGFRVRVTPDGLDFSRSVVPPGEEATVKRIAEDVIGWDDYTPLGVDALKRRISNQYSPNSDVRALTQAVKDSTREVLNSSVPGYAEMTKGWETASKFINEVVPEFSLGPTAKTGTAVRKISYALKQNNEYRQMLTEALDQFTNSDLKSQLAGYHLKDTLPKGITGIGSGFAILGGIATGALSPQAAVALMASSPRLVGETLAAMAKARGVASAAATAAPRIGAAAIINRDKPVPQFAKGGIVSPGSENHRYGAPKRRRWYPPKQQGPPPMPR